MSCPERLIVDIGARDGGLACREAREHPKDVFYVVDGALKNPASQLDNVVYVDRFVDRWNPLPIEDESADVVRMFLLMGEVVIDDWGPAEGLHGAFDYYKLIVWEAKRVLKHSGVLEVVEVAEYVNLAINAMNNLGLYTSEPIYAPRGLTYYVDEMYAHFDHSGRKASESYAIPMYFEAAKRDPPESPGL